MFALLRISISPREFLLGPTKPLAIFPIDINQDTPNNLMFARAFKASVASSITRWFTLCALNIFPSLSTHNRPIGALTFWALDQFAVGALQPADHSKCQRHRSNINWSATHKVVVA